MTHYTNPSRASAVSDFFESFVTTMVTIVVKVVTHVTVVGGTRKAPIGTKTTQGITLIVCLGFVNIVGRP